MRLCGPHMSQSRKTRASESYYIKLEEILLSDAVRPIWSSDCSFGQPELSFVRAKSQSSIPAVRSHGLRLLPVQRKVLLGCGRFASSCCKQGASAVYADRAPTRKGPLPLQERGQNLRAKASVKKGPGPLTVTKTPLRLKPLCRAQP